MSGHWDWIGALQELKGTGEKAVMATVVGIDGSAPCKVGSRLLVCQDGSLRGTIGGGQLELMVIKDAIIMLESGKDAAVQHYPLCQRTGQCCGGNVDVWLERIAPRPQLHIFGAGHVGQALARTLDETSIQVELVDGRSEWLEKADFLPANQRHSGDPLHYAASLPMDLSHHMVLVMTHCHQLDLHLLQTLIPRRCAYLGLIGSKLKWARFQQKLQAVGVGKEDLQRVTCPIGLFVSGKAPKEIAISVAAQILKWQDSTRDNESVKKMRSRGPATKGLVFTQKETVSHF